MAEEPKENLEAQETEAVAEEKYAKAGKKSKKHIEEVKLAKPKLLPPQKKFLVQNQLPAVASSAVAKTTAKLTLRSKKVKLTASKKLSSSQLQLAQSNLTQR